MVRSAIPAFEISTEQHSGDQEITDDDENWSGSDDNDTDVHEHERLHSHTERDARQYGSGKLMLFSRIQHHVHFVTDFCQGLTPLMWYLTGKPQQLACSVP